MLELKEAKGSTISLVWTSAFEGDSPITGYYLESKTTNGELSVKPVFASKQSEIVIVITCMLFLPSNPPKASWDNTKTAVDFSANQTEATLIEMNPATYDIRMFAENSAGTSNASNVLTITTGEAGVVFLET